MNAFDDELRSGLQRAADSVDVGGADAASAMQRGRQRARRTTAGRGALALALVAGLGGAVVWANGERDDPDRRVQVAEPDVEADSAESSSLEAASGGSSGLPDADGSVSVSAGEWAVLEPGELGHVTDLVRLADGTYVALSTAPADADLAEEEQWFPRPALYTSADGVSWSDPIVDDDFSISQLATSGGRLFAIGTIPGESQNAAGETIHPLAIGVSNAVGEGWSIAELPLDSSSVDGLSTHWSAWVQDMVEVDGGVAAVVMPSVWIDAGVEWPDLVGDDGNWHWTSEGLQTMVALTEPGPDFVAEEFCGPEATFVELEDGTPACDGPGENDTHTLWEGVYGYADGPLYTFDELGIAPDIDLLLGRPMLFVIDQQGVSERVELPGQVAVDQQSWTDVRLSRMGDAALLWVTEWSNVEGGAEETMPVSTIHTSSDGRTWTSLETPPIDGDVYLADLATVGGRLAGVSYGESAELLVEADGGWVTTELNDLVEVESPYTMWPNVVRFGDEGIVVALTTNVDLVAANGGYDFELDDGRVVRQINESGDYQLLDVDGNVLEEGNLWKFDGAMAEEAGGAVPTTAPATPDNEQLAEMTEEGLVIDDGTTRAVVSHERLERLWQDLYEDPSIRAQYPTPGWVAVSFDGVDWQVVELPDAPGSVQRDVVRADLDGSTLTVHLTSYSQIDEGEPDWTRETLRIELG